MEPDAPTCELCGEPLPEGVTAREHAQARHGLAAPTDDAGGVTDMDNGGAQADNGAGRVQTE